MDRVQICFRKATRKLTPPLVYHTLSQEHISCHMPEQQLTGVAKSEVAAVPLAAPAAPSPSLSTLPPSPPLPCGIKVTQTHSSTPSLHKRQV